MLPLCAEEGIGVIPWSPLARGFLAGNRRRDDPGDTRRAKSDEFARQLYYQDADFGIADRCAELAARRGVSPAQVALAWLLHKPVVTAPIVGATKPEHLDQAIRAMTLTLEESEVNFLEEQYRPHPVLGHEFTPVVPKQ